MMGINPLVDDYGYAVEKARSRQELLTAALKAGKEITPQLAAEIENAADAYASASAEADRLAEAQDKVRQAAEDAKESARDFAGTFIEGMMDGKSAADALSDALRQLGSRLLNSGLDQLFGIGGGSGANPLGIVGKLFGFDKGGYTGAGGKYEPAGVVHKGEYVFDAESTRKIGVSNLDAMRAKLPGFARGGYVGMPSPAPIRAPSMPSIQSRAASTTTSIQMPITINAPGADAAALARVERSVQELGKNIPKMVDARTDARQTRRTRA